MSRSEIGIATTFSASSTADCSTAMSQRLSVRGLDDSERVTPRTARLRVVAEQHPERVTRRARCRTAGAADRRAEQQRDQPRPRGDADGAARPTIRCGRIPRAIAMTRQVDEGGRGQAGRELPRCRLGHACASERGADAQRERRRADERSVSSAPEPEQHPEQIDVEGSTRALTTQVLGLTRSRRGLRRGSSRACGGRSAEATRGRRRPRPAARRRAATMTADPHSPVPRHEAHGSAQVSPRPPQSRQVPRTRHRRADTTVPRCACAPDICTSTSSASARRCRPAPRNASRTRSTTDPSTGNRWRFRRQTDLNSRQQLRYTIRSRGSATCQGVAAGVIVNRHAD